MFTAYNFVRTIIVEAAEAHDIQLLQISFTGVMTALQRLIPRLAVSVRGLGS